MDKSKDTKRLKKFIADFLLSGVEPENIEEELSETGYPYSLAEVDTLIEELSELDKTELQALRDSDINGFTDSDLINCFNEMNDVLTHMDFTKLFSDQQNSGIILNAWNDENILMEFTQAPPLAFDRYWTSYCQTSSPFTPEKAKEAAASNDLINQTLAKLYLAKIKQSLRLNVKNKQQINEFNLSIGNPDITFLSGEDLVNVVDKFTEFISQIPEIETPSLSYGITITQNFHKENQVSLILFLANGEEDWDIVPWKIAMTNSESLSNPQKIRDIFVEGLTAREFLPKENSAPRP